MAASFNSEEWLRWEHERLRLAREGNRRAFDDLYRAFAQPLFVQILMPRLGNREAAEDALAETFRSLLEHVGDFHSESTSVWFWLTRVAVNKATDMHRSQARKSRALASFESMLVPSLAESTTPRDALEQEHEARLLKQRVQDVLSRIHARYQRVLTMRLFEEKPREECARELEVKVATFDVLFLRSIRAFRSEWEASVKNITSEGSE